MRSLLTLILLCIFSHVMSQKDTSIYSSDFEKKIFRTYSDSLPVRTIDMLLAFEYNSNSTGIEKRINDFNQTLKDKGLDKYNRKKQIKEIYNEVHNQFLKKYEEKAFFNDIFTNGNYNCVTASALYALVLDYFKIDYVIKETPNHVFLVADPNGTSFLIETTTPSKGVYQFDERFKKAYVDYLHSNKIISDSEYQTSTIDNLFSKNYESAKTITPLQMAALQYYNKGVFTYDAKEFAASSRNLEKAQIVYPSPNIQFLYSNALQSLISDQVGKRKYDGKTLAKFVNQNRSSAETLQLSKEHFRGVTSEMVVNRPDLVNYNIFYNDFITNLSDSVDKSDYIQNYHEVMAYYYYLKKNYEKVLFHASGSYKVNPENLRTQQFVTEAIMQLVQNESNSDELNSEKIIEYANTFPFLLQNEFFVKILAYSFTMNAHRNQKNEVVRSIGEISNFCEKLRKNNASDEIIESIYSESAAGLVRDFNYDGAEAILKNGLEMIPASTRLRSQLSTISSSKKQFNNYPPERIVVVNYITPPAYNDEQVYASVKKYMTKCWSVDFYKKDGKTRETKVEQLSFIFLAGNKMKFRTGTEEHWGTWKLIESGPTLVLKSNEDKQELTILIYEASATVMRGIMSPYKNENKKIEFNSCEK